MTLRKIIDPFSRNCTNFAKKPESPKDSRVNLLYVKFGLEPYEAEIVRTFFFQNKTQEHICNGKKEMFEERAISQDSYNICKSFREFIEILRKKQLMAPEDYMSKIYISLLKIPIRNQERTNAENYWTKCRIH